LGSILALFRPSGPLCLLQGLGVDNVSKVVLCGTRNTFVSFSQDAASQKAPSQQQAASRQQVAASRQSSSY